MRYLSAAPTIGEFTQDLSDENPARVVRKRDEYNTWDRFGQTREERKAEEAAWAAKSGPVYIIKEGSKS